MKCPRESTPGMSPDLGMAGLDAPRPGIFLRLVHSCQGDTPPGEGRGSPTCHQPAHGTCLHGELVTETRLKTPHFPSSSPGPGVRTQKLLDPAAGLQARKGWPYAMAVSACRPVRLQEKESWRFLLLLLCCPRGLVLLRRSH